MKKKKIWLKIKDLVASELEEVKEDIILKYHKKIAKKLVR